MYLAVQALSRPGLILAALLLLAAGGAQAQNRVPPSVAIYERASSDPTITVERLFDLGEQAAQDLVRGELGSYSREEIDAVRKQMPGFGLGNIEAIVALPDVAFFADLSRRRGRPQDVAFFEALTVHFPDQSWFPAYMQQTTDVQGCLRLDGTFSRVDGAWRRFRAAYPQSYVRHVATHLEAIEYWISGSMDIKRVCACGEQPEAERDIAALATLGPNESMGRSAAALLRGLRDGSVAFKAQCRPN